MDTIKKLLEFFATGLNDFDFVRLFDRVIDFFKIFFDKEDDTTAAAN